MTIKKAVFLLLFLLAASNALAESLGKDLYRKNCAVCHGVDGRGGVGLPLALPSFLQIVPASYLKTTIRLGRPGRVMPAFKHLTDSEVDAIAAYILSWRKKDRILLGNTVIHGNPSNGKKLYNSHCAKCHGVEGQGGEGTGVTFSRPRNLPIIPPALNNKGFLAAASDQFIKTTLIKGRTSTPMVSFAEKGLSKEQLDDIVSYVRSFQTRSSINHTFSHSLESDDTDSEKQPPLLRYTSSTSLDETVENITAAIQGANFRLIRVQNFDYGLTDPANEDTRKVIIYFCNFNLINRFLKIDPRIGIFLPCRITVTERDGQIQLLAVNPKILSEKFNNNELQDACDEMYQMYTGIMEDAI